MTAERQSQFVDTNILVYAHDRSAGDKHARAKALLETLWNSQEGCLSIQVLQEFYVAVTQKVTIPMDPQSAAKIISDLSNWQVHVPKTDDIVAAIDLQSRYQISFRDAMIIRSALQLGCDILWSEDLNPGQIYDGVQVINPLNGSKEEK